MNTVLPFNIKAGRPITLYKDNNSLCKCSKMHTYVGTYVFSMCILYIRTYVSYDLQFLMCSFLLYIRQYEKIEILSSLSWFSRAPRKFLCEYLLFIASFLLWHCLSALNVRYRESFPVKNFIGWNPQKFSPANLSLFMVRMYLGLNFINCVAVILEYCSLFP